MSEAEEFEFRLRLEKERAAPKGAQSGFTMGLGDPIHGGAQMLTKMLPQSVVESGNRLNNWLADKTGLVAKLPDGGVDQQVREREQAYQAQRQTDGIDWARLGGNVINPANLAIAARLPAAAGLAGRVGIGSGAGAASSALAPVGEGDFAAEKAKQIGLGAAFGGALPAVASGIGRVISPKASTNPQLAALMDEGVRPTIGQTLGGFANKAEEKAMSLPFVGDAIGAARNRATGDLNKAVADRALSPIGMKAPDLSGRDLVSFTQQKLGEAYDTILPKLTTKADPSFAHDISKVRNMIATGTIDPTKAQAFERVLMNDVVSKFKAGGGTLTGQTMKEVESDLGRIASQWASSGDADARLAGNAIREVQSALRDLVQRSNPQFAGELKAINTGWANFKRLERAASYVGAEDGVFSASNLQSAVKALDRSKDKGKFARGEAYMQDLSDPAKAILGSKVPDSGTAGRLMNAGALAGGLANPAALGGLLGGSIAYASPIQSLLRSLVTARPAAAQPIAGLLNQASPMFGPASGLLGSQMLNQ